MHIILINDKINNSHIQLITFNSQSQLRIISHNLFIGNTEPNNFLIINRFDNCTMNQYFITITIQTINVKCCD